MRGFFLLDWARIFRPHFLSVCECEERDIYIYIYYVQQNLSGYHVKKTTEVLSFLSSCSLETVLKKMSSRQGCLKHFCPLLFLAKRACSLNIPHWISHYYDAQPVRTHWSVRAYYPVVNEKKLCLWRRCVLRLAAKRQFYRDAVCLHWFVAGGPAYLKIKASCFFFMQQGQSPSPWPP